MARTWVKLALPQGKGPAVAEGRHGFVAIARQVASVGEAVGFA
jgi:hypothetical protein